MTARKDVLAAKIAEKIGHPGLVEVLAEMSPTERQTLLMAVYRAQAAGRKPAEVLAEHGRNRFVRPASISPVLLTRWETAAWSVLPEEVEPVTLSLVCPLGTSSVPAGVDQDWSIATSRNTEVMSDPTNAMALICSERRKAILARDAKSREVVHLITHQRVLRPQKFEGAGLFAHFCQLARCSAGRDIGDRCFEMATMVDHIRYYLNALEAFWGKRHRMRIALTDFDPGDRTAKLEELLAEPLRAIGPEVEVSYDPDRKGGRNYYKDLCFKLNLITASGEEVELGDGGSVPWTATFLSNKKERLIISGLGSERVCLTDPTAKKPETRGEENQHVGRPDSQ